MTQEAPRTAARYITTAIPYVNSAPHIGFALEMIQADCLARLYRSQGHQVRFQAGSDDNSLKNVQAAEASNVPVQQLVCENAQRFHDLKDALNLSFDDFIRTSSDERHQPGVHALWSACAARGDIYKKAYTGLYCTGCEQFYKPDELDDGQCPEHGDVVDEVSEENYFFRLTGYEDQLREAITSGQLTIVPDSRRNEVLSTINSGLEDFSISRSAARAHGWGIPVPGDPEQVIYVWFDALANYITALGYGTTEADFGQFWHDAASREHVVGKGITRFHAVYWPAMLLSAGLTLPTRVLVHGYVTVEGNKIGKSTGNAIDPVPLANHLGPDALRYYLLRHIRSTEDGDFVHDRFLHTYDADLAGQLGNLAHRTQSMIQRYCDGIIPQSNSACVQAGELTKQAEDLVETVAAEIERFRFHNALAEVWSVVSNANRYVTVCEPWSLAKVAANGSDLDTAKAARRELETCLSTLVHTLRTVAICLAPLLPATSSELLRQLGRNNHDLAEGSVKLNPGPLLFPKRE